MKIKEVARGFERGRGVVKCIRRKGATRRRRRWRRRVKKEEEKVEE